jgi:RimJ/RimL family protein N-acetyltransferase
MRRAYRCLPHQVLEEGVYEVKVLQDEDIEFIRCWRNAQMAILRQSSEISFLEQKEYYEKNIWPSLLELQPANILFGFFKNKELIGYGGLVHIAWEHHRAEVSFLLAPNRVTDTTTYMEDFTKFLKLIKKLAFIDLGLNRLYTETYDIRPVHVAVLESNNFIREGILRNHVFISGKPFDSIYHGLLKNNEK